jgi:hypothetical protein
MLEQGPPRNLWAQYHHEKVLKTKLCRLRRELRQCRDFKEVDRIERQIAIIEEEVLGQPANAVAQ